MTPLGIVLLCSCYVAFIAITGAITYRYCDTFLRWDETCRVWMTILAIVLAPICFIIFSALWIGNWNYRPVSKARQVRKYG